VTTGPTLLELATAWQPQRPGDRRPRDIRDALVEPDWEGLRVVAAVDEAEAVFVREGEAVVVPDELAAAMRGAFNALGALLEGQLTTRALRSGEGVKVPSAPVERPSMIVPRALRRKDDPWVRSQEHERRASAEAATVLAALAGGSRHAFVATDLLWLDGMPLDDIPLLERKRLLASVIDEAELVRVGAYVTAASVATHVTWSAMGFRELHYRAANSRYRAGEANPDCAVAPPPASIGAATRA
jgi:hypothetical protein